MYKVTKVFEYLVNDNTSFLSAHDILDQVAGMTYPLWDGYQDMLPKNSEGEEEYIPWVKVSYLLLTYQTTRHSQIRRFS